MAKFELRFKSDSIKNDYSIINLLEKDSFPIFESKIRIELYCNGKYEAIVFDKSTAIKFAKTLRTEINKITEEEVKDGNR
jgi:hypothetical protein